MQKILILKGLPGSGKSTWAKEQKGYVRINKDDLRAMMGSGGEVLVLKIRDFIIEAAMLNGQSVIVDDTNFNPIHEEKIRGIAGAWKKEQIVEIMEFDTPIEECIRRDALREGKAKVGESVIRRMAHERDTKWKSSPQLSSL